MSKEREREREEDMAVVRETISQARERDGDRERGHDRFLFY